MEELVAQNKLNKKQEDAELPLSQEVKQEPGQKTGKPKT